MQFGYAPTAHRVVCLDFGGTLYPWAPLMAEPEPNPGAVDAVKRLKAAGYRIVIFTSRLSPTWLAEARYSAADQMEHITRVLERDDIPYDEITSEKVPAECYVDDKAIRYSPGDWDSIVDWVLFSSRP